MDLRKWYDQANTVQSFTIPAVQDISPPDLEKNNLSIIP